MEIRKTKMEELEQVMAIYARARQFMAEHGNATQWGTVKPAREIIVRDIEQGNSYVCVENGEIAAVFYFNKEVDPTYLTIYEGAWKNDLPYGVVHRIASAGTVKGAGSFCLNWAFEQCGNLKIDTHHNNIVMQNVLKKNGFEYCGIIHLLDGDERLAYQKLGENMVQIYATLGPACADREIMEKMFQVGLTGMRLNLSHTGLEESSVLLENFHQAAKNMEVKPQLLIDMQGPELRVGKMAGSMILKEGDAVVLGSVSGEKAMSDPAVIPVPAEVISTMEYGDEVLLNDGKIALSVTGNSKSGEESCVEAVVIRGGTLSSHKSVKISGKQVELPVLTAHDISNIRLASKYGVTGLMQPFVQSGRDLVYVRRMLKEHGAAQVQIFAKIENRAAVADLTGIIEEADVVIIARGDLGNDMELWELPAVQKEIEGACQKAGKPYIVVTQMLASMEENAVPTRAEVSDIFHAVMHGAYGVMITGESAVGKYPVEAVKYLANTAKSAEEWRKKHA